MYVWRLIDPQGYRRHLAWWCKTPGTSRRRRMVENLHTAERRIVMVI